MQHDDAHPPLPAMAGVRRRRVPPPALWLLFLLAAVMGCGGSGISEGAGDGAAADVMAVVAAEPEPTPTAAPAEPLLPEPTPTQHPIAAGATALPSAPIGLDALADVEPDGPQPVALRIEDLQIDEATIIPVGVNPDKTFEVPPADEVGWYRFGPRPGDAGSSVLAAHIAFNGVDGVFRDLSDVEVGAVVEVTFDDGSSSRYRITEVTDYLKDELPDSLFARTGDPQLALITCGGAFNPQLRSYESNTVAIAVPI